MIFPQSPLPREIMACVSPRSFGLCTRQQQSGPFTTFRDARSRAPHPTVLTLRTNKAKVLLPKQTLLGGHQTRVSESLHGRKWPLGTYLSDIEARGRSCTPLAEDLAVVELSLGSGTGPLPRHHHPSSGGGGGCAAWPDRI